MHIIGLLGIALLVQSAAAEGPARQFSLFTDRRSHRLDDLITVVIDEQNNAQNNATTRTKSESKSKSDVPDGKGLMSFIPGMKSSTDLESKFTGDGKTARNGTVSAVVSTRVVQVLANGNLVLEGTKEVVVNDETETLKVSGMARPEDIAPDNTIRSSRLAQAQITYSGENRTQMVSDISRMMKIMAKELNIPLVCLSQLSRANEARTNKRPVLSDLRESGAIEQDADIVIGLYRDGYYDRECQNPNDAEAIILKNRHGELKTIPLMWLPEYTSYVNAETRREDEEY